MNSNTEYGFVALAEAETARRVDRLVPCVELTSAVLFVHVGADVLDDYARVQTL